MRSVVCQSMELPRVENKEVILLAPLPAWFPGSQLTDIASTDTADGADLDVAIEGAVGLGRAIEAEVLDRIDHSRGHLDFGRSRRRRRGQVDKGGDRFRLTTDRAHVRSAKDIEDGRGGEYKGQKAKQSRERARSERVMLKAHDGAAGKGGPWTRPSNRVAGWWMGMGRNPGGEVLPRDEMAMGLLPLLAVDGGCTVQWEVGGYRACGHGFPGGGPSWRVVRACLMGNFYCVLYVVCAVRCVPGIVDLLNSLRVT